MRFFDRAGVGLVGVVSLLGASGANAAVDASVEAGIQSLVADAATLGGMATGAVVTITLIVLGIRLVKRMLSKAV